MFGVIKEGSAGHEMLRIISDFKCQLENYVAYFQNFKVWLKKNICFQTFALWRFAFQPTQLGFQYFFHFK